MASQGHATHTTYCSMIGRMDEWIGWRKNAGGGVGRGHVGGRTNVPSAIKKRERQETRTKMGEERRSRWERGGGGGK